MYILLFIVIVSAGIGLALFQYLENRRKNKLMERHERKKEQFEELLKLISEKKDESDSTVDSKKEDV